MASGRSGVEREEPGRQASVQEPGQPGCRAELLPFLPQKVQSLSSGASPSQGCQKDLARLPAWKTPCLPLCGGGSRGVGLGRETGSPRLRSTFPWVFPSPLRPSTLGGREGENPSTLLFCCVRVLLNFPKSRGILHPPRHPGETGAQNFLLHSEAYGAQLTASAQLTSIHSPTGAHSPHHLPQSWTGPCGPHSRAQGRKQGHTTGWQQRGALGSWPLSGRTAPTRRQPTSHSPHPGCPQGVPTPAVLRIHGSLPAQGISK